MSGFENYAESTKEIEIQIERKGVVLGIDWNDDFQVRNLAREALDPAAKDYAVSSSAPIDHKLMAKHGLFGLAAIMLRTMEESASVGIETHGGPAWKALAKALWAESEYRKSL